MQFGPLELGIILVIILLLFGVGRIGKIAGELGSGMRSFRENLKSPEEKAAEKQAAADVESDKKGS